MTSEELLKTIHSWDEAAVLDSRFERGEPTLEVPPERIAALCRYLKDELAFVRLSAVTVVDRFPAEPRFEVIYLVHSLERGQRLRLKCRLGSEQPEIDSVTDVWRSANWYEREVFDLMGVRFRNHPDLRRILMPEGWKGHPLRKDYPVTGEKYTYCE